jgi:hypothetical protein
VGYGKAVSQVVYSEIINAGHHLLHDQPTILRSLFATWVASLKEDEPTPVMIE